MRGKIHAQLPEFLTEFPPVICHPYPPSCPAEVPVKDNLRTPLTASPREFRSCFVVLGGDGRGWGTVSCLRSHKGGMEVGMLWGREVPTSFIQFPHLRAS